MKALFLFIVSISSMVSFAQDILWMGDTLEVHLVYTDKYLVKSEDTIHILDNDTSIKLIFQPISFKIPIDLKDGQYQCYYDTIMKNKALRFGIKDSKLDGL